MPAYVPAQLGDDALVALLASDTGGSEQPEPKEPISGGEGGGGLGGSGLGGSGLGGGGGGRGQAGSAPSSGW